MTHADLVDQLGGSASLADHFTLDQSTVSCWRTRGVSRAYRPAVADLARKRKVALPEGFLDPPARAAESEAA